MPHDDDPDDDIDEYIPPDERIYPMHIGQPTSRTPPGHWIADAEHAALKARITELQRRAEAAEEQLQIRQAFYNSAMDSFHNAEAERDALRAALQKLIDWQDSTGNNVRKLAMELSMKYEPCGYYCGEGVGHVDHHVFNAAKFMFGGGDTPSEWDEARAALKGDK